MWKKIGAVMLALMGTCSVVYAVHHELRASPSTKADYYDFEDTIHHINNTKFQMGGLYWWIIYADQNTGIGYIIADNINSPSNCGAGTTFNGYGIDKDKVDNCINGAQTKFAIGNDDVIGKWIKKINGSIVQNLQLPTSEDYWEFTKHETEHATRFNTPNQDRLINYIWLAENPTSNSRLLYPAGFGSGTSANSNGYTSDNHTFTYLTPETSTSTSAKTNPVFKISLPQKNYLKKVILTATQTTYTYDASEIQPQTPFIDLGVNEGEGPYEFSLESGITQIGDIDQNGNQIETGKTISSSFELVNVNGIDGTAAIQVKANSKLSVGDHYIKVKVKDKSTNQKLYIDEDDNIVLSISVRKSQSLNLNNQK